MILSTLLDSVYIQPSCAGLPFQLEVLSDNSRACADCYLIHKRNAKYFDMELLVFPCIQWKEKYVLIQHNQVLELMNAYALYQFYALQTIDHYIGVTGTNGKTTTVYYLEQLLQDHYSVATVGTLGIRFRGKEVPFPINKNTTLPLLDFVYVLKQLAQKGCEVVLMEVSSIGYCEGRVVGIPFSALIAHSVTTDHLDYHGTFEAYLQSKRDIVALSPLCICSKTAYEQGLVSQTTLVIKEEASVEELNRACAVTCCEQLQLCYSNCELHNPPGRREKLLIKEREVVIDHAHTPDALRRLLREYDGERVVILGCGGDRDRLKRCEMAKISSNYASLVILTLDNPRTEYALQPILDMQKCAPDALVMPDRRVAIWYALEVASQNQTIFIVGKGDERTIEFQRLHIPYSDLEVVIEWEGQSQRKIL